MVKYNELSFSGKLLIPGFSIYIIQISKSNQKYYYVGMTGDNYYPSARSALHRLSGHLEKLDSSTQNQLMKGLKRVYNTNKNLTIEQLQNLNFKLYQFPIEGYVWKGSISKFNKNSSQYKKYSNIRKRISELEKRIIFEIKKSKSKNCLNNTNGEKISLSKDFETLMNKILKFVK